VKATPWPLYPWERDLVPIVRKDDWATGPVLTGADNLATTDIRSPDVQRDYGSYPGPQIVFSFNKCLVLSQGRLKNLSEGGAMFVHRSWFCVR
jgi:hypothetical protein